LSCDTVVANERYITTLLAEQVRLRRHWLWWWRKAAYTKEHCWQFLYYFTLFILWIFL